MKGGSMGGEGGCRVVGWVVEFGGEKSGKGG